MDEFSFIEAIKPKFYKQSSVIRGIGDDGAIINLPTGFDLVVTTDTMVNGIHFSLDYMTYEDIGYRVLAANISDLAAMGSMPLYYTVNISSPSDYDNVALVQIINGMKELALDYRMDLIGGDTTSAKELVITVTAFGSMPLNTNRLRSSAKHNDVVFVTGNLGESGYGLQLLQNQMEHQYFIRRHVRPKPRIDFVEATKNINRICLNDISDGISSELYEIAESSNVSIEIDWSAIPIHEEMLLLNKEELMKLTLSAGEDFELLGTCSIEDWIHIKELCKERQIKVTHIGRVINNKDKHPTVFINKDGMKSRLNRNGYTHGRN